MKSLYKKNIPSNLERKQKLLQEGNILRNKTFTYYKSIKGQLNKNSLATAVISNFIGAPLSELREVEKKKFRGVGTIFFLLPKLTSALRSCQWACKPILLKTILITAVCGITYINRKKKVK